MACRPTSSSLAIVLILFASITAPAGATALLYSDRAGWEAATSAFSNINFEGFATPSTPGYFNTAAGLTLNGVQFIGLTPPGSYYLFTQDPGAGATFSWGSGDILLGPNVAWGGGYIQASLPPGTTAIGTDLMTHTPYAASIAITLSTGEVFTVPTLNNPQRAFAGFTSDVEIASVRFKAGAGYTMIDNFSFGQTAGQPVSEAPEAVTFLLGAAGLVFLLLARGLRRAT